MAVGVRVRGDFKRWQRDLKRVRRTIVPRAQQRAMTAAVRRFNTETVRSVAATTGVPQKVLRPRNRITRTGKKSRTGGRVQPFFPTRGDPFEGGLKAIWYPVDAARLGKLRETGRGVSVKRRTFPGAFVAKMPNGKVGAFKRTKPSKRVGAGARGKPTERGALPIKKQTVPLNPMGDRIARVKLVRVGRRVAMREFERQTAIALRRK